MCLDGADGAHRSKLGRRTRGQIAPDYIVDLVEFTIDGDISEGLQLEHKRFLECRNSPQSAAMRHVFFAGRASGRLPDIPRDTAELPINSVAVIGAGTMGGGIAMCFANAGINVTLVEMERLGQKTGAGYYRYDPETRQRQPDPLLVELAERGETFASLNQGRP